MIVPAIAPRRPPGATSPAASARIASLLVALVGGLGSGGCSRNIGDECMTSADCDPRGGTRTCDISQPGGYCIVDGCDARSCPEDSACVRFFPEMFLSVPCVPPTPGTDMENAVTGCTADEICLDSGLCARRSWERRVCVQSCSENDDCRDGYECRLAGTRGTMPLTADGKSMPRFCGVI
jgi:hypothetical protein